MSKVELFFLNQNGKNWRTSNVLSLLCQRDDKTLFDTIEQIEAVIEQLENPTQLVLGIYNSYNQNAFNLIKALACSKKRILQSIKSLFIRDCNRSGPENISELIQNCFNLVKLQCEQQLAAKYFLEISNFKHLQTINMKVEDNQIAEFGQIFSKIPLLEDLSVSLYYRKLNSIADFIAHTSNSQSLRKVSIRTFNFYGSSSFLNSNDDDDDEQDDEEQSFVLSGLHFSKMKSLEVLRYYTYYYCTPMNQFFENLLQNLSIETIFLQVNQPTPIAKLTQIAKHLHLPKSRELYLKFEANHNERTPINFFDQLQYCPNLVSLHLETDYRQKNEFLLRIHKLCKKLVSAEVNQQKNVERY